MSTVSMQPTELTTLESQVLDYLTKSGKSLKSHVGVSVGKKQPKNAGAWANPILESLIKKGLVNSSEELGKTFYSSIHQEQKSVAEEMIERAKKKKPANKEKLDFRVKVEGRRVVEFTKELIKNKHAWESDESQIPKAITRYESEIGKIPEDKFSDLVIYVKKTLFPNQKVQKIKANLLDKINKQEVEQVAQRKFAELQAFNDDIVNEKNKLSVAKIKKRIKEAIETEVAKHITEQSMGANIILCYIQQLIAKTIGFPIHYKEDPRNIQVGQRVLCKAKRHSLYETFEAVVTRVVRDEVIYNGTYYWVQNSITNGSEQKVPSSILEVLS